MTATELGEHLKTAIPRVIEEEIEAELKDMRGRIKKRVMDRLGQVKINIENIEPSGLRMTGPEIHINVSIGADDPASTEKS